MATKDELSALNWLLEKFPRLFPNLAIRNGTTAEDWAGIDAWLIKDGIDPVKMGLRRHGSNDIGRDFKIRLGRDGVDYCRFEFYKINQEGGPDSYLQVWDDVAGNPIEFVLVNMKRMRLAGCFEINRYRDFWLPPDKYYRDKTIWAKMPVDKLVALPGEPILLADVNSRRSIINQEIDAQLNPDDPIKHFQIGF